MTGALAARAEAHWKEHLPKAYAAIEDPPTWFANLAAEAQAEIETMADSLRGPDDPEETFSERSSRNAQARHEAEATVLREMVLLPPETPTEEQQPSPEDEEIATAVEEFQTARDSLP